MSRPSQRFRRIIALLLLAALVAGLGWTIYAPVRQEWLDQTLIAAIQQNNTQQALALLAEGTDPNARDNNPEHRSPWRLFVNKLHSKSPAPLVVSWTEDQAFVYYQVN